MPPNSDYTDIGGRITIDIDDAANEVLNSYFSVTWSFGFQYNNSNMPDVFLILAYGTKSFGATAYGVNGRLAGLRQ
jgi:hypothetical protein